MSNYKLVPVEPTPEMVSAAEDAYMPFGDMELALRMAVLAAPAVQGEPVGWYTEDHLDDKSATTYNAEVAQRWRAKGWPVTPLYTAPQPAPDVACSQSRESSMVVLERDEHGKPAVWCDPEIADLVSALNKAGIRTVASCSGHGHRPGNIMLSDGRELAIARDFDEARKIDAMFPGINGEPPMVDVPGLVGRMRILVAAGNRLNAEAEECIYAGNIVEVAGSEYWCEFRDALEAATEALATYRQKGGEV